MPNGAALSPTLRADARRNRALIVRAARAAMAEKGAVVPLSEVARRAGLGAGTVYRHFPSKEHLVEAVLSERVNRLTRMVLDAVGSADPGETLLYSICPEVILSGAEAPGLCEAVQEDGWPRAVFRASGDRFVQALQQLLSRARASGMVRGDVEVQDLAVFFLGCVAMQRQAGQSRELCGPARMTIDALRAEPRAEDGVTKRVDQRGRRDESAADRNGTSVPARCVLCGGAVERATTGRPRRYCSAACRQRAHRRRARVNS